VGTNYDNLQLQPEDYKFLSYIKLSISRGILGEVIPSLRAIFITWKPGDSDVKITFYHDGSITDSIQSHYSAIIAIIGGDSWDFKSLLRPLNYTTFRSFTERNLPSGTLFAYPFCGPIWAKLWSVLTHE